MNNNLLSRLSKILTKPSPEANREKSSTCDFLAGKTITVKNGDTIPCDGEVIEGFATVDESAIVGVSSPALIEAAEGRNQVLAGTCVIEGELTIRCVNGGDKRSK